MVEPFFEALKIIKVDIRATKIYKVYKLNLVNVPKPLTNLKVQLYLTYSAEKPSTQLKQYRMELLEQTLEPKGLDVRELFPNKQKIVLDYILYITAATGISKVGSDRIAERTFGELQGNM